MLEKFKRRINNKRKLAKPTATITSSKFPFLLKKTRLHKDYPAMSIMLRKTANTKRKTLAA